MDISNASLRQHAQDVLSHDSRRKFVLIHTGFSLLLALALQLVDWFLNHQIDSTGGLGGVQLRSILYTAQSLLYLSQFAILPLWELGYLFVTLRFSRRQDAVPQDLLRGFRHLIPALLLTVLECIVYCGLILGATYLASIIFTLTPFSMPMQTALEPYLAGGTVDMATMEQALIPVMKDVLLPLFIVVLLTNALLVGPMYYRLRLCRYILLDEPGCGAMYAFRKSRLLMRGNCKRLLKLDLSFWWFYALELLASAVYFFDVILELVGISLPGPGMLWVLVALILYALCELAIHSRFRNPVFVTYAAFYDSVRAAKETPQTAFPMPTNNYE